MRFLDLMRAELGKLSTLPAAILAAIATVIMGAVIGAAVTAVAINEAQDNGEATSPVLAVTASIAFVQVGIIVVGIMPVAHEYAGRQIHTTLMAMPRRGRVLTAKTIVAGVASALTGALTVGASLVGAALAAASLGAPTDPRLDLRPIIGAVCYLTLIGLLAHVVATLVRHLIPSLIIMAGLTVMSPLLARYSSFSRWLPDRAGMQLIDSTDSLLTPLTGMLVLVAWILVVGAGGATRFARSDA